MDNKKCFLTFAGISDIEPVNALAKSMSPQLLRSRDLDRRDFEGVEMISSRKFFGSVTL